MEQVSKEMMNKLNYVREHKLEYQVTPLEFLNDVAEGKHAEISEWYRKQRYIAEAQIKLIEHVFEDTRQFKSEINKKYIVRSKKADNRGKYRYLVSGMIYGLAYSENAYVDDISDVIKFDTREEAEMWTSPVMEVVEAQE